MLPLVLSFAVAVVVRDLDRAHQTGQAGAAGRMRKTSAEFSPVLFTYATVADPLTVVIKLLFQGVFMAEASTARVGVKRDSVALYYYDCRSLRDVVFEVTERRVWWTLFLVRFEVAS